jgi:cation diffusion facilitator family transporter
MQEKARLLRTTLLIELAFLAPDVVAAVMANSLAVWADLLRCGTETIAVFLAWLTVRKLAHPGAEYEYGLGKLENISTVGIAGIFVLAAGWVVFDAVERFREPTSLEWGRIALAYLLNLVAIGIDGGLWWRNRRLARAERSPVMDAQVRLYAIKTVADVGIGVVLTLAASLRNARWAGHLDPAFSLVIAAAMVHSAYGFISESVRDLLDGALEEGLQLLVLRCLAGHFDDYRDFHGMRSRRAGSRVFIEIFLEFDGSKAMSEVQAIIDRMRDEIAAAVRGSSVTIAPVTQPMAAV